VKVGDIVKQKSGIIHVEGKPKKFKQIGIVIDIQDSSVPQKWSKLAGRLISVLWENGNLTPSFAESSLEVVNKPDDILDFSCTCIMV